MFVLKVTRTAKTIGLSNNFQKLNRKIMKKINIVCIPIIAIVIIAGTASLCVNSGSHMFTVLDNIAAYGLISFFAYGSIALAHTVREVEHSEPTRRIYATKALLHVAGIACGMASIGYALVLLAAKLQNLESVHELSFYGTESGLMVLITGAIFYGIARIKCEIRFRVLAAGVGMLAIGLALTSVMPNKSPAEYPAGIISLVSFTLGCIVVYASPLYIKGKHIDQLRDTSNSTFLKWLLQTK